MWWGIMVFIYGLYDKNGLLRYIGKANNLDKRLDSHMRDSVRRNTPVYRWIRKNGRPSMRVIEADCVDWEEAERRLISEARNRGDNLLNIADGGDQPVCPGHVRSENARKATKNRPPNLMRTYRALEAMIRTSKRWGGNSLPKLQRALEALKASAERHRSIGELDDLEYRLEEYWKRKDGNQKTALAS